MNQIGRSYPLGQNISKTKEVYLILMKFEVMKVVNLVGGYSAVDAAEMAKLKRWQRGVGMIERNRR